MYPAISTMWFRLSSLFAHESQTFPTIDAIKLLGSFEFSERRIAKLRAIPKNHSPSRLLAELGEELARTAANRSRLIAETRRKAPVTHRFGAYRRWAGVTRRATASPACGEARQPRGGPGGGTVDGRSGGNALVQDCGFAADGRRLRACRLQPRGGPDPQLQHLRRRAPRRAERLRAPVRRATDLPGRRPARRAHRRRARRALRRGRAGAAAARHGLPGAARRVRRGGDRARRPSGARARAPTRAAAAARAAAAGVRDPARRAGRPEPGDRGRGPDRHRLAASQPQPGIDPAGDGGDRRRDPPAGLHPPGGADPGPAAGLRRPGQRGLQRRHRHRHGRPAQPGAFANPRADRRAPRWSRATRPCRSPT